LQHDLLELHLWFVVPLDFLAREILVPKQKDKPSKLGSSARDELRTAAAAAGGGASELKQKKNT
jgi:hypothetical protein